jgi:hypothetical protein
VRSTTPKSSGVMQSELTTPTPLPLKGERVRRSSRGADATAPSAVRFGVLAGSDAQRDEMVRSIVTDYCVPDPGSPAMEPQG